MKKSIFAISIILVAIVAIGSVSAFDLGSLFGGSDDSSQNQTVTIGGIDFNVPDGYNEDKNQSVVNKTVDENGVSMTNNLKAFINNNTTVVAILVTEYKDYNITEDIVGSVAGDAKTINNVSGYLKTDDNGYKVFSYVKDNKLVVISTNNEKVIGDFIKN